MAINVGDQGSTGTGTGTDVGSAVVSLGAAAMLGGGVGLALAAYQTFSALRSKKKAKRAGKKAARLIMEETQETLRRLKLDQKNTLGTLTARAGASGVRMGGSTAAYRDRMTMEMQQELDWTLRAGQTRARQAKKQGGYVGQAAGNQGVSSALSILGSVAETGYNANWWGGTR